MSLSLSPSVSSCFLFVPAKLDANLLPVKDSIGFTRLLYARLTHEWNSCIAVFKLYLYPQIDLPPYMQQQDNHYRTHGTLHQQLQNVID